MNKHHAIEDRKKISESKHSKHYSTSIKNVEKQYGLKFDANSNTNLSTYLKKNGLPSLGKVVEQADATLRK